MAPATVATSPESSCSSSRFTAVATPAVVTKTKTTSKCEVVDPSLQKQLSLLVLIRCLRTAQLAPPPIVIPFYQNSCQLELSTILWLGSWYSALAAICEMPSGILSDVLGRKLTLQLAFVGMGACWIVTYASSKSSPSMVVIWLGLAQLFRAMGSSMYSGTDMAFLFELLKKHRQQQQQQNPTTNGANGNDLALELESRQVVLSTVTEALVAALGGLLSRYCGASIVILMSAMPPLAGAAICFGLEETASLMDNTTKKEEKHISPTHGGDEKSFPTNQPNATSSAIIPKKFARRRSSIVNTLNQPSLRVIFGVGVVLNCGTYVASTALNPLLWQQVGISNFAGGFLQAANSGMTALGALMAPTLKRHCSLISHKTTGSGDDGTQGLLLLLLSTSTVAYGLMTWNAFSTLTPSLQYDDASITPASASLINITTTIGASWLLSLVRGLAWPVLGSALNAAIGDNGTRATVLSLFSGAIKIGMVFTGFALGSVLRKSSSLGNACALCGLLLFGSVVCYLTGLQGRQQHRKSVNGKKNQ